MLAQADSNESVGMFKAVAKAFGCTVNDVLIAAVSGAIRQYLINGGDEAPEKDIRATVPVNLRPLEHALDLGYPDDIDRESWL